MESLGSIFLDKIDQIPSFDIRYSAVRCLIQIIEATIYISKNRAMRIDGRIQIVDTRNHISWIDYTRYPFDPPAAPDERCLTLCAMPFLPITRNPQPRIA